MSLAYYEYVTLLSLVTELFLVAGGAWLGAVLYMTRREVRILRGGLLEMGESVAAVEQNGEQRYETLSSKCRELGVRISQAMLRGGYADSSGTGFTTAHSSMLESFLDARHAAAAERVSAALVSTRNPASLLEPLRFAPRPNSLVCFARFYCEFGFF